MLDASAERLADAEADATVAPVESARMSDASVNCLANAKANAADAMQARIASPTPRPMLSSRSLSARERPMRAPIASPMPGQRRCRAR